MRKFPKLLAINIAWLIVYSCTSCQVKTKFGEWSIENKTVNKFHLSWAKFAWTNDSLGKRYFEKTAMFIPVKIEGLPYNFQFQFDLGANVTTLQGNTLKTIINKHPEFNRTKTYRGLIRFWKSTTAFKDLCLSFGGTTAKTKHCAIMKEYGESISVSRLKDSTPIKIGSIGADMFQNKILVIDYPNERFAICDTLPVGIKVSFTTFELDALGRVILPMQLGGKSYKVMFDNGASIFQLITTDDKISSISTAPDTDSIAVSSWGVTHNVIGRPLKQQFYLGSQSFTDAMIYADFRKEARTKDYDAIAGNALFWDKMIIIDFKNKAFGVQQ